MAADVSAIVGIVLMSIGGVFIIGGLVLCYFTKGEYYNQDEVQAMVAAEVLEEEKKKRLVAAEVEAQIKAELEEEKQKRASSASSTLSERIDSARSRPGSGSHFGELGAAPATPSNDKKRRRGAPLMAA